jgi:hypothetical protein
MRRRGIVAAVALVAAAVFVPTAAQADPNFYATPLFGIANAPGGQLLVADSGKGIVDADTGALVAPLPGVTDVAPIGRGDMLALTSALLVVSGLSAIIDLQFGPGEKLYVAQLEDAGVGALEGGGGVGGSVHACDVATGSCETVVSGIPILTAIAFRGATLWGAIWALVPGQADVVPLA